LFLTLGIDTTEDIIIVVIIIVITAAVLFRLLYWRGYMQWKPSRNVASNCQLTSRFV